MLSVFLFGKGSNVRTLGCYSVRNTRIQDHDDFFQDVKVRVHFFPDDRARRFISALRRGNIQHGDGAYDLTISKREAGEFIKQAAKRHEATMAQWKERRP